MSQKLLHDFLLFVATIDPVGTLLLFSAITSALPAAERRAVARRAIGYSGVVLLASVVAGQFILKGMGIRLVSLQVAGGAILFLFGLQMIFGDAAKHESGAGPEAGHDLAVFPLAVPSIAGPGTIMAAIVLTDNDLHTPLEQAGTAITLVAVLSLTFLMMLFSELLLKVLGKNGSAVLIRVLGMLLAALAVEMVMSALGVERWTGKA